MSNLVEGTGVCGIGLQAVGQAVRAGEHAEHARHRLGRGGVDADDARVRMRRAHHRRVGLAVDAEIVAEAALAGQQALVLLAADRMADGGEGGAGGKFDLFVHGPILHRHARACRGHPGLISHAASKAWMAEHRRAKRAVIDGKARSRRRRESRPANGCRRLMRLRRAKWIKFELWLKLGSIFEFARHRLAVGAVAEPHRRAERDRHVDHAVTHELFEMRPEVRDRRTRRRAWRDCLAWEFCLEVLILSR